MAGIRYYPELSESVHQMLTTKDPIEYQKALETATATVSGYTVSGLHKHPDYGYNSAAQLSGIPLFQPVIISINDERSLLLDGAVVSFNRQKNIVQTVVQGRDSSVKEFINNGEFHISVSGIMCQKGWEYPLEQVKEFMLFMNHKGPLEICHEVLNAVGVHSIVVMEHDCPKAPLFNCQTFSFSAVSDEPLSLTQTHKI